jgi:hypothetical protein
LTAPLSSIIADSGNVSPEEEIDVISRIRNISREDVRTLLDAEGSLRSTQFGEALRRVLEDGIGRGNDAAAK